MEVALEDGELLSYPKHKKGRQVTLSIGGSQTAFLVLEHELINDLDWFSLTDLKDLPMPQGAFLCQALATAWPGMPNAIKSELLLPAWMIKLSSVEPYVFFGGSFNPWHEGHRECVNQCPKKNIIIVPDFNPWKERLEQKCAFSSFKDLCFLLKDTDFSIYPGFWGLEKSNPTASWLPLVTFPSFGLLIGDDNFLKFDKWLNYKKILGDIDFLYVVPRNHNLLEINQMKKKLEIFNSSINILNEHSYQSISSTKIREKLNQN